MYSIAFPDMLSVNRVNLVNDHEATKSNLYLILKTMTRECLFGDPYYGTNLLRVIFQPNSILLQDVIADEIYTAIVTYIPQLKLTRNNIKVYSKDTKLYATVDAMNLIDYKTDLYTIELTDFSEA